MILAVPPFLLAMLVLLVLFALNVPFADVAWISIVCGWSVILLGTVAMIAECVEWVRKYRLLKQLGLLVPRKGFRWWALLTWVVAGIVLNSALSLALAMYPYTEDSILFSAVLSILNLLIGVWTLAFFPGLIVSALYLRRFTKAFETLRFQLAPPHPKSAKTDARGYSATA